MWNIKTSLKIQEIAFPKLKYKFKKFLRTLLNFSRVSRYEYDCVHGNTEQWIFGYMNLSLQTFNMNFNPNMNETNRNMNKLIITPQIYIWIRMLHNMKFDHNNIHMNFKKCMYNLNLIATYRWMIYCFINKYMNI